MSRESNSFETISSHHCIIIDNCVDTGTSAKAAYHALGNKGIVLAYAMSDRLLDEYSNSFRKTLTL